MIKTEKNVHGTRLITVWFAQDEIDEDGIIQYKESAGRFGDAVPFDTLVSDLNGSDEDIRSRFTKGCKYKVNRAYREDIDFVIIDSTDITDGLLNEFLDFFEDFWKSKDTVLDNRGSLLGEMKDYIRQGALTIAYATVSGAKAVYHTHIYDDRTARLLHSASLFRLKDSDSGNDRNIIGMANRALHFEEMKYFRSKGLTVYDWGGAGKGEDVASITEFKESFGGTPVTFYDSTVVNGTRAKLVSSLSEIKHRIKG